MQEGTTQVLGDILCDECGESLQGLSFNESCKCGKNVRNALQGTLVQWGVTELKRLQKLVRWMAWGWVSLLGGLVISAFVKPQSEGAGRLLFAMASFFLVWSAWRYTAIPADKLGRREKVIRVSGAVFLLAAAFDLLTSPEWRYQLILAGGYIPFELQKVVFYSLSLGLVVFQSQMGARLADLCSAAGMASRSIRIYSRLYWLGSLGFIGMLLLHSLSLCGDLGHVIGPVFGVVAVIGVAGGLVALVGFVGSSITWCRLAKRVRELKDLAAVMDRAA